MRVTSGIYRGKRLTSPRDELVRPTSDMVKQAVFNVLQFDIEGAKVLDLFSGSGAMGIEALSRGCAHAVFNDIGRESVKTVRKNLDAVCDRKSTVYCMDYLALCAMLKGSGQRFDIVFIDPPYDQEMGIKAVNACAELAQTDAVIVHEYRYQKGQSPDYGDIAFRHIKSKKYGETAVDFIYF